MGKAAFGIGWLLWRQNRTSLIGLVVYLVAALTALRLLGGALNGPAQSVIAGVLLGYALLFLAGLGSLNLFSDDQSFKPYLFTLPVRTRSLVFWHMAYPMAVSIAIWLVGAWFLFVPTAGYHILVWPAALIAVLSAIWQASLWYPSAWYLRPVFIVLGVAGPAFFLGQAWVRDMPIETISLWMLAVVPFAALIAIRGVERARRGQTSRRMPNLDEMGLAGVAIERSLAGVKGPTKPFSDALAAQSWLEWRTNGIILPVMIAFVYLFTIPIATLVAGGLASGFSPVDLGIGHIRLLGVFRWWPILVPMTALLLNCGAAGLCQGTLLRDGSLAPFYAARALTSWDLVVAKVRMATRSALMTWAVTLALMGIWFLLPATDGSRGGPLGSLLLHYGPPRTPLYVLAGLLVIMIWSWRAGICALCIALTGRKWLGWVAAGLFLLQTAIILFLRAHPPVAQEMARLLPDPALALAIAKPLLVFVVFYLLRRKNLASVATLTKLAGGWLLVAIALSGFLIWLLPPALAPAKSIIAGVALLLPIVRPSLAPLALDWNRHR